MFKKLSFVGRDLLLETLPKVISGDVAPVPQDESQVVFSPNIKPDEEILDFSQTAFMINAKIRALRPDPVAYTMINDKRTKIWKAEVIDQHTDLQPGSVVEKRSINYYCPQVRERFFQFWKFSPQANQNNK